MPFWTKEKRGQEPGISKGKHAICTQAERANVNILAGPPRNNGTRTEESSTGFARFLPACYIYSMTLRCCSLYAVFHAGKGEGERFFLSLSFLNNQLIVSIPKGIFWGGKTLVPLRLLSLMWLLWKGHVEFRMTGYPIALTQLVLTQLSQQKIQN